MTFAWPHLLWLVLLPVTGLVLELARRRRDVRDRHPKMLHGEAGAHELSLVGTPVAPARGGGARPWLHLGLALAMVALARPQWGKIEERVFDESREILIAVDLSRSMLAQDIKPSRLDRAKLLIQSLLERLKGDRVGLVVFSGTAFLQSPLSADYEILREFLPALGPDYLPEGGSNYGAMIESAVEGFTADSTADRFLIVLSDGEATDEEWTTKLDELKEKNIRVISLGVGTAGGAMIPDADGGFVKDERGAVVLSKLENATLQELARATNGVYRDASAWIDLAGLLQETIQAGRAGKFVEEKQARLVERFQWALAPALLFLLLSFWREFPVRPREREITLQNTGYRRPEAGRRRPEAERTTTVAVGVLLLLASGIWHPASGRAADAAAAEDVLGAPLAKLAGELAVSANVPAKDWKRFADTTLDFARRQSLAQAEVNKRVVTDGIAAVDAGKALDPKFADWDALRQELEKYLEKPEEPPKQDQQSQDQQQQDKDQQDQNQKQNQQQQQGQQPQQQQDGSKQPSPDEGSPDKDPQESNAKNQSDAEKKDAQQKESAFGNMKDDIPPPPPSNEMQNVGGTPEKNNERPSEIDPAMALPLQKLDRVRNQDSPARLFQILESGEAKPEPKKKGKDW